MSFVKRYILNLTKKLPVFREKPTKKTDDVDRYKHILWDEKLAVNISLHKRKEHNDYYQIFERDKSILHRHKLARFFTYTEIFQERVKEQVQMLKTEEQKFLPDRVKILGPDLAAAHFIIARGGSVKFCGMKEWIGKNEHVMKLPLCFMPGYLVEGVNASEADLVYEGLQCLHKLRRLKWLSLRGLKSLNDFSLDIISGEYGSQLEYLDLTGCTGITHYGLACFYRFKCLKVLNVTGLDHTPEFKLTCLMIQDLLPDLKFVGINFEANEPEVKDDNEINSFSLIKFEKSLARHKASI